MRKILVLLILSPVLLFGQSQNPPTIDWQQVKTKNFTVIFPKEIKDYGIETALIIDSIYYHDTKTFYRNHPSPVNLLLYNRSVVSNAYAALSPRRMVWYTIPPQSLSLTLSPWNKTLAIHEFRHVTQYSVLNYGFTNIVSTLMGEFGQSAMINWSIPNWYMEGDAIFNETKFSKSGRGRMPAFSLPIRTILLNNQNISYEKAHFRSYKTYFPNHYYLGYYMVSYINRHYGEEVWNKILAKSATHSYWPYTFERSIKKYTGNNVRKTYKKAMDEIDSLWSEQISGIDITYANLVNKKKKRVWTNYFEIQYVSEDTILCLKSGFDDKSTLYYVFSDGKEKRIREIRSESISYAKDKVVYTRFKQHPRWGEVSYNDIVVYNLKTNKLQQITQKGKYFSAEISPDGKKIVAVSYTEKVEPKIVVLDLNGEIIFEKKILDANNVAQPVWTIDGKNIVFLKTSENGESMEMLNTETLKIKNLISPHWIKFENPECSEKYVYFNYDYSGITNIYALDLQTHEIFQVTSRPYGAIEAIVDGKGDYLYFTEYDLNGIDIKKIPLNSSNNQALAADWKPLNEVKRSPVNYFSSKKTDETFKNINTNFAKSRKSQLKVKDYKPARHFFNIHSWTPMISGENYGFDVYSSDIMNTIDIVGSLYGNIALKNIKTGVNISYKKYFPVIGFGVSTGRNGLSFDQEVFGEIDSVQNWYENEANLSVSIPLNFSTGIYYRNFETSLSSSYIGMSNFQGNFYDSLDIRYTDLVSFSFDAQFSNRRYMSYRELLPDFGQFIAAGVSYVPDFFNLKGYRFYATGNLYLPGIIENHGIKLNAAFEKTNRISSDNYNFSHVISLPRGFEPAFYDFINKYTAEYRLPLFYPDWNIPYLLFFKRFRANLFYDYAFIRQNASDDNLSSVGIELLSDFHILRLNNFTLSAGLRASYLIDQETFVIELISFDVGF